MRRSSVVLALAFLLAACSGSEITLDIDVLSFLTEGGEREDPHADYAVLVPPTGLFVEGLQIVPPTAFRLVDAIDDLTVVDEGELIYRVEAVNREGDAAASIRVRLAASESALQDAGAALEEIALTLVADSTTTATGSIDLADSIVEVFANDEVWVSIEADLRVAPGAALGDSLTGRLWLRGLDVRVVADEDFF